VARALRLRPRTRLLQLLTPATPSRSIPPSIGLSPFPSLQRVAPTARASMIHMRRQRVAPKTVPILSRVPVQRTHPLAHAPFRTYQPPFITRPRSRLAPRITLTTACLLRYARESRVAQRHQSHSRPAPVICRPVPSSAPRIKTASCRTQVRTVSGQVTLTLTHAFSR
jgi:hypothetical protein